MLSEELHVCHGLLHLQLLHAVRDGPVGNPSILDLRLILALGTKVALDMRALEQRYSGVVLPSVDIFKCGAERFSVLEKCNSGAANRLQILQISR